MGGAEGSSGWTMRERCRAAAACLIVAALRLIDGTDLKTLARASKLKVVAALRLSGR